jgi:hypothetical protein
VEANLLYALKYYSKEYKKMYYNQSQCIFFSAILAALILFEIFFCLIFKKDKREKIKNVLTYLIILDITFIIMLLINGKALLGNTSETFNQKILYEYKPMYAIVFGVILLIAILLNIIDLIKSKRLYLSKVLLVVVLLILKIIVSIFFEIFECNCNIVTYNSLEMLQAVNFSQWIVDIINIVIDINVLFIFLVSNKNKSQVNIEKGEIENEQKNS